MINIKDECRVCTHHDTCKYSKDYIEFGDKISNLENKLNGDVIAEGVAQLELTCKYYKPITSTITTKPMLSDPNFVNALGKQFGGVVKGGLTNGI